MPQKLGRISRHLCGIVEDQQSDDGRELQTIAQLLRVQERKARLTGLDAPARRTVDVISHEVYMGAVNAGVLTDDEFDRQKAHLLGG